ESGARVAVRNSISRKDADFDVFARTLADLFVAGQALDWPAITGDADRSVTLPKPAWTNEAHWTDSEEVREYLKSTLPHPFLGRRQNQSGFSWHSELNTKAFPYLKDHRLQSDKIFPGAGYMDMIVRVGRELHGDKPLEIENAQILDALFLPDDADILLSSLYDPTRQRASVQSRQRDADDDWIARSQAFLRATDVPAPKAPAFDPTAKSVTEIPVDCAYDVDASLPFVNYGPAFQVIEQLWMSRGRVVARMKAPDAILDQFDRYEVHPALLDGCLQLCDPRMTPARIRKGRQPGDPIYLPIGARQMRFYKRFPQEIMVHAKHRFDEATQTGEAEFIVTDLDGEVLAIAEGLAMQALPTKAAEAGEDGPKPQFARQVLSALREPFVPA
ncbi:polyketide synthase dehydratase domain-containing protein, partial [Aestuariivita boseongensis]|uniref:polyketide synthase dehydratase domain-containing protein n=1 Tax=Aestuariivita boseongensis TaxID=1470562 RepID=UPI0012F7A323